MFHRSKILELSMRGNQQNQTKFVRDLLTLGVSTIRPEEGIIGIVRLLVERNLEAVVVVDDNGHAVGVVSREEIVNAYSMNEYSELTAEDIMKDEMLQVPPDIPVAAAVRLMQDHDVRSLYVAHHGGGITYPAAVLSYENILKYMLVGGDEEINELGIKAKRQSPIDLFMERRDEKRRKNIKINYGWRNNGY